VFFFSNSSICRCFIGKTRRNIKDIDRYREKYLSFLLKRINLMMIEFILFFLVVAILVIIIIMIIVKIEISFKRLIKKENRELNGYHLKIKSATPLPNIETDDFVFTIFSLCICCRLRRLRDAVRIEIRLVKYLKFIVFIKN